MTRLPLTIKTRMLGELTPTVKVPKLKNNSYSLFSISSSYLPNSSQSTSSSFFVFLTSVLCRLVYVCQIFFKYSFYRLLPQILCNYIRTLSYFVHFFIFGFLNKAIYFLLRRLCLSLKLGTNQATGYTHP